MDWRMEFLTKPQHKTQFNLRLDPELHKWLKDQSIKHDRPINYIINHAIKQFKKGQEI